MKRAMIREIAQQCASRYVDEYAEHTPMAAWRGLTRLVEEYIRIALAQSARAVLAARAPRTPEE